MILGTYCDTRLTCLYNSPIYSCRSNLWWWQNRESFTIHLNREAEKYRSLLTPEVDIKPSRTDWNFDGEAGAHMDHIFTGLQIYKCPFILNVTFVFNFFFFFECVVEHRSMLPREVVQCPSLEIFKILRESLELQLTLLWAGEGGLDDLSGHQMCPSTSAILILKQLWVGQKFEWMTRTMKLLGAAIIICFMALGCRGKWLLQCT